MRDASWKLGVASWEGLASWQGDGLWTTTKKGWKRERVEKGMGQLEANSATRRPGKGSRTRPPPPRETCPWGQLG